MGKWPGIQTLSYQATIHLKKEKKLEIKHGKIFWGLIKHLNNRGQLGQLR